MRFDRARIQIGSISHFGLLEMSRQRLRISLNESISSLCPHCEGTGRIRSIDTAALQLLRSIEDEAQKGKMDELHITAHRDVVLFILNHKRGTIAEIETRYELAIVLLSDDSLIAPEYRVEQVGWRGQPQAKQNQAKQRQNRRGRNRPHTDQDDDSQIADDTPPDNDNDNDNDTGDTAVHTTHSDADGDDDQPKRRRRGRRGGRRRRRRNGDEAAAPDTNQMETGDNDTSGAASDAADSTQNTGETTDAAPASKSRAGRGRRRGKAVAKNADAATTAPESVVAATPSNDVETVGADAPDSGDASPAQPTAKKAASKKAATKKKAAKKALKKAATKATPKTRAKADLDVSDDTDDMDKPAKKATKKKAAKKAPKKAATKAADAAIGDDRTAETGTTGSPSTGTTASRAPISSTPDDVVEVGGNEPAKPRRGWWSRG
jgi:ribonuclease E